MPIYWSCNQTFAFPSIPEPGPGSRADVALDLQQTKPQNLPCAHMGTSGEEQQRQRGQLGEQGRCSTQTHTHQKAHESRHHTRRASFTALESPLLCSAPLFGGPGWLCKSAGVPWVSRWAWTSVSISMWMSMDGARAATCTIKSTDSEARHSTGLKRSKRGFGGWG